MATRVRQAQFRYWQGWLLFLCVLSVFGFLGTGPLWADGKVVPPRQYKDSLEELAQEAIIIFREGKTKGKAVEDLILKIRVKGDVNNFAWIVPFPNEPKVKKESAQLFRELYNYVQARLRGNKQNAKGKPKGGKKFKNSKKSNGVRVISRQVVGSYDVAVVEEKVAGSLNKWLRKEGYQTLPRARDVINYYRQKGYVFACIKVADAQLRKLKTVDLHPLRFTFKTGGRDGIYFPMRMTGLQKENFDINLYVFYRYWINDNRSRYGFEHRGFELKYRDYDSPKCKPNGGKAYSSPRNDPFLKAHAFRLPTVTQLFQTLHPGKKFYLTNIQAMGLDPGEVRDWSNDLWLFPYYTGKKHVPFDARPGGVASEDKSKQNNDNDNNN